MILRSLKIFESAKMKEEVNKITGVTYFPRRVWDN